MQIPCVYLPGPAPAVSVGNSYKVYLYISIYMYKHIYEGMDLYACVYM